MKFILGKKVEMSQIFRDGKVIPVTKVKAGPCSVTQIKTKENDGYQSAQIGYGYKKKIKKPLLGHLKKSSTPKDNSHYLKEFLIDPEQEIKLGDEIKVDIFEKGDIVDVSSKSKGKGFQGVVKRHGFHGSPATHGHKDQLRMPGSIGSTDAARVFKGKKMGGRMGGKRITVKNLEVIDIIPEENLLLLKGAVPGARNSILEIKESK